MFTPVWLNSEAGFGFR